MRTPTLISVACALALGACGSHSLTRDPSGSGGVGTGGIGTGGAGTGGAGTGGVSAAGGSTGTLEQLCSSLEAEYQQALGQAKFCDVGTTAPCAKQVNSSLRSCASCPTLVTDASKLTALQQTYDQAGCDKLIQQPCFDGVCPPANDNVCVSIDGGSQGYCSYVPGTTGTGGTSGAGGSSGAGGARGDAGALSCGDLAALYKTALAAAKSCDLPGVAGQCQKAVPAALSTCSSSCIDFVNDPTQLTIIQQQWQAAGCVVPVLCPAIACLTPVTSLCTANDAGGASCVSGYAVGATAP